MRRNTLNFVIDLATALGILAMIATGLVVRFVLPQGTAGRRVLWGLGRHDWGDLHFWLAVALGLLLLVHVSMHWQWVCTTALRLCRIPKLTDPRAGSTRRNLAGLSLVVVLVAIFWGFVGLSRSLVSEQVVQVAEEHRGTGRSSDADTDPSEFIRGSMTLAEAAAAGRISVESLRDQLNLPGHIDAQERLGALSREHGFSMDQLRKIVEARRGRPSTRTD